MKCRSCATPLRHTFLDLGYAPPSNSYLEANQLNAPEIYFPLKIVVCEQCWLVQTEDYVASAELFTKDYAYFSSVSTGWLAHAQLYVDKITSRLGLDSSRFVVEIASNDGYLLKNFLPLQIPCLGIEPTQSTAEAAERLGVPVLREFFNAALARTLVTNRGQADLIVGNNVFAHVPDINDFTLGLSILLKPTGTITLEFPHLLRMITQLQFDTVYHEHFSYLSLHAVHSLLSRHGLKIYDIDQLSTHGGSLRIYVCHKDANIDTAERVAMVLAEERRNGLLDLAVYLTFQNRVDSVKNQFLEFLLNCYRERRTIAAYGAAAKGVTLLNYAGVKPDLLPFVTDRAPSKQGKFLPGSHIPILPPEQLYALAPDFVLILPWNLADEIRSQLSDLGSRGTKFVTVVPSIQIS